MKPTKTRHFAKSLLKKNKISPKSDLIFSFLIFIIIFLIISNPSRYSQSTINGLNLFITAVLPGLFPFMLLTKLLTELGVIFKITQKCDKLTKKLFGTPGISLYAFFMSILSGYPIGAKIISDLYEKNLISQNDAKRMSIFCTTSGPIFVIGAVGTTMFKNYKIGLILYFSHILSSLFLGIIYNILSKKQPSNNRPANSQIEIIKKENLLSNCITQTINSIFVVGAYITIFYLLTELCENLNIINLLSNSLYFFVKFCNIDFQTCKNVVYGLIEVTRGCKAFALSSSNLSTILCCGIISFSGLSIIMQSMAFLKNTQIKMHQFIFTKLIHSLFSMIICALILIIF